MAILSWLNLGVCVLLFVACLGLHFDARGARQALAALAARVSRHDAALAALTGGTPPAPPPAPPGGGAPPESGHARSALGAGDARERQLPPGASIAPPLDTQGDREGTNPAAPPSSGRARAEASDKALRAAMAEAAEEQRLRARAKAFAGLPIDPAFDAAVTKGLAERAALDEANRAAELARVTPVGERDTPEEPTLMFSAAPSAARGARPTPYPAILGRSPLAPRRAPVEGPTLVSRIELPGSRPSDRLTTSIDERYEALRATARAKGLAVDHCNNHGAHCHDDDPGDHDASACLCGCDGCVRAGSYVAQAEREIMGPPQAETPRRGQE